MAKQERRPRRKRPETPAPAASEAQETTDSQSHVPADSQSEDAAALALAEAHADAEARAELAGFHPITASWSPLRTALRPAQRSTCPYLRRETADGALDEPFDSANPANRCVAYGGPVPQSSRQQQLVCLRSGHVDCPRYLRGTLLADQAAAVSPRRRRGFPRATVAAIGVLLAAAAVALAFVVRSGSLVIPVAGLATSTPTSSLVADASASGQSPSPSTVPSVSPSPSPVEPSPSILASPSPSVAPTSSPPVATPTPQPTSNRFALLTRCPNRSNCWIYTVRSGDNLYSIAHYFGVPLDSIYAMNPWLRTTSLRAGQKIQIPTPTR